MFWHSKLLDCIPCKIQNYRKPLHQKPLTIFLIPFFFIKYKLAYRLGGINLERFSSWSFLFAPSTHSLPLLANNLCNKDPVCNSLTNRAGEILARFTNIKCKIHNLLCLTSSFWPNKISDTAMNHSFLLHSTYW